MAVTRVDLLRHGACQGGEIYRGRTDSTLSAVGERQMAAAVSGQRWDLICSSPLQRCRRFAQQLSHQTETALVVDADLIELDFGDWDGRSVEQVWQQQQSAVLAFWQDPVANPPPAAETLTAMRDRVVRSLHALHQQHSGKRILIVTHGGVIRLLLGYLLQMPVPAVRQLSVAHGSLSRVELYQQTDGYPFGSEVLFSNRLASIDAYDRL